MKRLLPFMLLLFLPLALGATAIQQLTISQAGRDLIAAEDAATQREALGLEIGTDVLAPNGSAASLTDYPAKTTYSTLDWGWPSFNPASGVPYYCAQSHCSVIPSVTANVLRYYVPRACKLRDFAVAFRNQGTLASNHASTIYLRVNDTTDYQLVTGITNDAANKNYSTSGLDISLAAGDYLQIKWTTPSWTTFPTNVFMNVTLGIEWL